MKTKKTILNFITEVVPLGIIIIIGLYKSKLLISNINTNNVGLYQLYSQLLGYTTIFEFGMTGALLYRFFEPVNKNNQKKINILFSTGRKVFNCIAFIMTIVSIGFTFLIPFLIKDNPFQYWYILLTFLMYISTNIIYYLIVSYKVLLEAEQKKYITNIIIQTFEIIKSVLEIISLLVFKNLIALLLVGIITTILSSFIIVIVCKKHNPNLKATKEKDYSMLSDVKSLFVHKVAYLVNNNIDLLLITKILGLSYVVVYSMYNYIVNSLKKVTSRIYVSVVPSLGNLLIEDRKKAESIFYEMNNFMFFIAILICTTLLVSINQFITLWYDGEIYTTYLYGLGFAMILYVSIVIQPMNAFTDAGGIFKETKICAILEAIINLVLSLILIHFLGIFGILFATFLGYTIADNLIRSKIIFKNIFHDNCKRYYQDLIVFYIITIVIAGIEYFIFRYVTYPNIFIWFICSSLLFIINFMILAIIFKVIKKDGFFSRMKTTLFNKLKRKCV